MEDLIDFVESLFGKRLYGKIGIRVELYKRFYVKTQFFHICLIPFVPIGSYIVLDEVEDEYDPLSDSVVAEFTGIRTKLLFRSIVMAWARCCLLIIAGSGLFAVVLSAFTWRVDTYEGRTPELWRPLLQFGIVAIVSALVVRSVLPWLLEIRSIRVVGDSAFATLAKEVARQATIERLQGMLAGVNTGGAEGIRELFKKQKPSDGP